MGPSPDSAKPSNDGPQTTSFLLVSAIAAAGLLYFAFADPATGVGFWTCPFHRLTGLYCPGCGGQRALHALLRGRIVEALSFNAPLALFFAPAAVYGYAAWALGVLRIVRLPMPELTPPRALALAALLFAFGVLRNLPFAPFAWLAP